MNALACAPDNFCLSTGQFKFNIEKHIAKVKKLQARIVKALKEGRYNKVKVLQRLLNNSLSAKILAIKKVTENKGKRTPGIDKVVWKSDREKVEAIKNLSNIGYKAKPLRRIYIPKKNGKKRPLGIPTMHDRAMQALYLFSLDPIAETLLDKDTYGFRKGRSTADANKSIFGVIRGNRFCAKWVIEGDIKGCFDNISHEWLINNILIDKKVLRQWLKAGIIFDGVYSNSKKGTPQGGIISPCLANLALNGLGEILHKKFMAKRRVINGKEINNKVHTIFYADDFIVTGKDEDFLRNKVLPVIKIFMEERGLTLSEEKTKITHISDGFDFLGQNTRGYKGKVLQKPSTSNIKSFLDSIRKVIKGNPTISQEALIDMLNPKIRGWSNYHRKINAKRTFSYVDKHIYDALISWCYRRHSKKGRRWIVKRYFHSVKTRNWVFGAKTSDGTLKKLILAADTKIIRHIKIRREANPYDENWQQYFEEREGDIMFMNMNKRA